MFCIFSVVRSSNFRIFQTSFLITYLSPEIPTSMNLHFPSSLSRFTMSGYFLLLLLLLLLLLFVFVFVLSSLVTDLFFLILLLNQRWSPPFRLQASHCSTFRIMLDVPSIAVCCSESIECVPRISSKFFLRLLVAIPVAPIITGIIVHFRFHIRCISIPKLLYFNFFSASFWTTFLSEGIIFGLFAVTSLSVCTTWFHNTVTSPSSYTGLCMCVYHLSVLSMPKALHIE